MKEEGFGPDRDPLVGLHNRRYILRELERHIEIYKRYGRPFALLMVGFDNLKWVNSTFGDTGGDSVLDHLVTLMKMSVRDVDIASRCREDEFLVIMPEIEKQTAQVVGRRIAHSMSSTSFKIGPSLVDLAVSFGIASCPEDGLEAEGLLQAAAKQKGRGEEGLIPGLRWSDPSSP